MNLNLKTVLVSALVVLVVLALGRFLLSGKKLSDPTNGYEEGIHYRLVDQPAEPSATVSVDEFFWYGCPHCQAFEPKVRAWSASLPDDVIFQQIPVTWNEFTELHASVFFVALESHNPDELHDKLFAQIIGLRPERNLASHVEQIGETFADHGIDKTVYESKLTSPSVKQQVDRVKQLMKRAQISSTPSVLVAGRWVVLNNEAVGAVGVFNVVDYLVQKARDLK